MILKVTENTGLFPEGIPEGRRGTPLDLTKFFTEMSPAVETAFVTDLKNGFVTVGKKLAGMDYP